jgi:hypothetical protein
LSETRTCFIAIAFQVCFRICQKESLRNKKGLELSGTHQFLVYTDNFNDVILAEDINTIKKNRETLLEACREIGLEVKTEKTKYIAVSRQHNLLQNHNLLVGNKSFEKGNKVQVLLTVTKITFTKKLLAD